MSFSSSNSALENFHIYRNIDDTTEIGHNFRKYILLRDALKVSVKDKTFLDYLLEF